MLRLILMIGWLVAGTPLLAQEKNIDHREQTWLAYFNQTRFTQRSGMWIDLHARLTDRFVNQMSISILRAGYVYYLTDNTRLTAGYGYVTQYNPSPGVDVPEHRPWQQIQWFDRRKGYNLMQYFRVEERYRRKTEAGALLDEYGFNWRFRYAVALTIPLKGREMAPGVPFLFLNDEVHINAGKEIVNNYFDQNRLFVGFGYQFTQSLNAQLGYLNVFQQLPASKQFVNVNAVRLFVFHNLNYFKP